MSWATFYIESRPAPFRTWVESVFPGWVDLPPKRKQRPAEDFAILDRQLTRDGSQERLYVVAIQKSPGTQAVRESLRSTFGAKARDEDRAGDRDRYAAYCRDKGRPLPHWSKRRE